MRALIYLLLLSVCADTAYASFLLRLEGTIPDEAFGGNFVFTVTIPTPPRSSSDNGSSPELRNLRGTVESLGTRLRLFPLNVFFYGTGAGGGFDTHWSDDSESAVNLDVTGDSLFYGENSRPQFAAGVYRVVSTELTGPNLVTFLENPSLTITEQSVPEGNSGYLMIAGLLAAALARYRGRRMIACHTKPTGPAVA